MRRNETVGFELDGRARRFHRAVERLYKWPSLAHFNAARRSWSEVRRYLKRYKLAGGQPEDRTIMLYHLANADALWKRVRAERPAAFLQSLTGPTTRETERP